MNALYESGARNFLVANLPDLGEVPVGQAQDASFFNQITASHNQGLATLLDDFSQSRSDAQVVSLEVNSLFDDVLQNPASFGFSAIDNCFAIADLFTNPPNPVELAACGETSLFYDELHPTSRAHNLVANLAVDTLEASAPRQSVSESGLLMGTLLVSGASLFLLKRKSLQTQAMAKSQQVVSLTDPLQPFTLPQ